MSKYEQMPPSSGRVVTSENDVLDLQTFLESGEIKVEAVAPQAPVVPIGVATNPKYEQMPISAFKIINENDQVIDLIELLTSGAIKVQVEAAVSSKSYVEIRGGIAYQLSAAFETLTPMVLTSAQDFSLTLDLLTYNGTVPKLFEFICLLQANLSGAAPQAEFILLKNGVTATIPIRTPVTGDRCNAVTGGVIIMMAPGDTVEVQARLFSGNGEVDIFQLSALT
jgi:hypothetical protein